MGNIYNFSRNVFQEVKQESSLNRTFLFIALLLLTIPLPFVVNNLALALLVLFSISSFKQTPYKSYTLLYLPICLFVLMAASYFWSIDKQATLEAIPKEIALLLISLVFMKFQLSKSQVALLLKLYSFSIVALVVFFSIRAIIRYIISNDIRAFFYHGENDDDYGLVPKLLNAIHVSAYVTMAFFYFFTKEIKSKLDVLISFILGGFLILLSSKNIILVFIFLILIYYFFYSRASHKMRLRNLILFGSIIILALSFGKIKERFQEEFRNNTSTSLSANVLSTFPNGVHNISIYEAWNNKQFTPNDYFPGTAFRVYQIRMFLELLKEEPIFLNGFGLNASKKMLLIKEEKYNLYKGYGSFNFHNQYIQNFAELGIFGFLLLLLMLGISLKKSLKNKDFIHFSFTVLMISLFLTESFLWRQRGVVFFTLFYCIFNTMSHKKIEN